MRAARYIVFLTCGFSAAVCLAHEARPGYLQLTQTAPTTIELLLKVPADSPTHSETSTLMKDSPEQFREETTVSFAHIFFQEGSDDAAAALLAELHAGAEIDVSMAGDPLPLPSALDAAPEGDIDALFGQTFKAGLRALDIGAWTGPVVSGPEASRNRINKPTPSARKCSSGSRNQLRVTPASSERLFMVGTR